MLVFLRNFTCAGIVVLQALLPALVAAAPCDAPEFDGLRSIVRRNYGQWQVVSIESLSPDDASIWKEKWGNECPGIAAGSFDGSRRTQYAVLLIFEPARSTSASDHAIRQMRLLHVIADNGFKFRLLDSGPAALVPVIRRLPPGTYHYFKKGSGSRTPMKSPTDMVLLELMEASSFAYLVDASRVKQFTLSF